MCLPTLAPQAAGAEAVTSVELRRAHAKHQPARELDAWMGARGAVGTPSRAASAMGMVTAQPDEVLESCSAWSHCRLTSTRATLKPSSRAARCRCPTPGGGRC